MDRRHLWIRSQRQQAILRIRHEVINAVRDFFNGKGFILADTPIFTPAACEGTTTLFPVQYFEDTTAYLTQSGQLYNEANAMALGRVYCLRADVPRREVQDAPAPDRVLDGRARDGVRDARRRDGRSRRSSSLRGRARAREAPAGAEDARARHQRSSRRCRRRSRASRTTRRSRSCRRRGSPFEWGGDFGAPDETALSEEFDRPVCVHRYPSEVKAFYMKPDPERPEVALGVDVLAPEGYGEIIGGGERISTTRSARRAHQGARPAAGSVRVVSRPAPLRHRAARRLRHGHRARRRLDLRHRAPARGDPVSADAVPDVSREHEIGLVSLGCPKNLVDGEVMLGSPSRRGTRSRPTPRTPTSSS